MKKIILISLVFALIFMGCIGGESNTTGKVTFNADYASGSKDAKIKIVEFSDYLCPFCQVAHDTMKQVKAKYGKDVSVEFKHVPLHKDSYPASVAAECAREQGKFDLYGDLLFDNSKSIGSDLGFYSKLAKELALDVAKFEECYKEDRYNAKINADINAAREIKLEGTPTFVINGELVVGAASLEEFSEGIDRKLKE